MFISFVDDVFPEGPEQLEMFLSAAPGALIVSPAYASITILNDDPPLPGIILNTDCNDDYVVHNELCNIHLAVVHVTIHPVPALQWNIKHHTYPCVCVNCPNFERFHHFRKRLHCNATPASSLSYSSLKFSTFMI